MKLMMLRDRQVDEAEVDVGMEKLVSEFVKQGVGGAEMKSGVLNNRGGGDGYRKKQAPLYDSKHMILFGSDVHVCVYVGERSRNVKGSFVKHNRQILAQITSSCVCEDVL